MIDSNHFCVKSHFQDNSTQNDLLFQPILGYFKKINNSKRISALKSKGLSGENIKPEATPNNSLSPPLNYINIKIRVQFDRSCLRQDKLVFDPENEVNIYIVYEKIFLAF